MRAITDGLWSGLVLAAVGALGCVAGCSRGTRIVQGPPLPAPTPTVLARGEPAPRLVVTIVSVRGGTGFGGSFRAGDHLTVDYRVAKARGVAWRIDELPIGLALVSGPTFNYQRVIAEQSDVVARSQPNADGSYSYTFLPPLPQTYLAPLNDTPAFGGLDGELTGQALLDGSYTVGLTFAWDYTVEGTNFRSSGETTANFTIGASSVPTSRAVASTANCNRCHGDLRVHDGLHGDLTVCLLCHTSGAEDANVASVVGTTPGESVDARVLFHKLHDGAHLPSVLGIGFDAQGDRVYDLTPRRYVTVDSGGGVHDYSNLRFPAWPNRSIPLPHAQGYNALSAVDKKKDDALHMGMTSCAACHGDPDGPGPLGAPAQGGIAFAQPSRRACNGCHDTTDYTRTIRINGQEMPPQADDSFCTQCHAAQGGVFGELEVHQHPLLDTIDLPHDPFVDAFATGLNLTIQDFVEGAGSNADGTIDPGETIQVRFGVANDAGAAINASTLGTIRAVISGPTTDPNLVLDVDVPRARFTGPPPYTSTLPERILLEFAGRSTSAAGETFATARAPHWQVAGALTRVRVRTGTSGVASALAQAVSAPDNFVDVTDASAFARDDFVVLDDGVVGAEEYLRVQFVETNRLWFSSPASPAYASSVRHPHAPSATVRVVTLVEKTLGVDYALAASTGTITELTEFGAGNAVIVDYVTDFRLPARYPTSANGSPDLGETSGEWAGKTLVDGTYRLGLSASFDKTHFGAGGAQVYTIASPPAVRDFLVGSASAFVAYDGIASGAACNACHQELFFHGGRSRGFDDCILCHANAGAEDRPRYAAANAPATTGVAIDFGTLLHTIHRGSKLANAATFAVNDAGSTTYPDNFTTETFQHVAFPADPGDTAQCAKCHGASNTAWKEPAEHAHPHEQIDSTRSWALVCSACHDGPPAQAHIALQTPATGAETCSVCHGVGSATSVELFHETRER